MGSGRYLVARSQVPGTKSEEGRGRGRGGMFPSGRQAADNNQVWTADRRTQDCRAQIAKCLNAEHGWLVDLCPSKDERKEQRPGVEDCWRGAQQ